MAPTENNDFENAGDANCCATKIEHDKFFIIWTIGNFNYCRQPTGEAMSSCIFSAKELGSLKFRLDLYPRGTSDHPDDIMVCIRLITDKDVKALVQYMCCVVKQERTALYKQEGECIMVPGRYCHMLKLVNRKKLMEEKATVLPEDKLHLMCALKTSSKEETGIVDFKIKSML